MTARSATENGVWRTLAWLVLISPESSGTSFRSCCSLVAGVKGSRGSTHLHCHRVRIFQAVMRRWTALGPGFLSGAHSR